MNLKLSNNPKLELLKSDGTSGVSDNFKEKASGLMITGCPLVAAMDILSSVEDFQKNKHTTTPEYAPKLQAIRVQLPYDSTNSIYTYSGTFDELTGYSIANGNDLSGYDSYGNLKLKPSLIGTWKISDYIDSTLADTLSAPVFGIYDANEPVLSADYIIDWNEVAVQCVDSTKPNYNPAVAIILNSHHFGDVHENTNHFDGKWWISKEQASEIKSISTWFKSITGVVDTNGIVSDDTTRQFQFTEFDSFSGFTGIESVEISAFSNNLELKSIKFPNTLTSIASETFKACPALSSVGQMPDSLRTVHASAFNGCSLITDMSLGRNMTEIEDSAFGGCASLTLTELPSSLKYISNSAFKNCASLTISEIPSSVGFIGKDAFNGCSGINGIRINNDNKITALSGAFTGTNGAIYLGTTKSSIMADKLKRQYKSESGWASCSTRLSSWYKKEYGEALADITDDYEIQDFVMSDGVNFLNSGAAYTDATEYVTDVGFCEFPSNSANMIQGSATMGLKGIYGGDLVAKVGGETYTISPTGGFINTSHNYSIDLTHSRISKDGVEVFKSEFSSPGDNSAITFFGDNNGKFVGTSWMNRIIKNGTVSNDFVPVRRKSDNAVGFYDMKTRTFIGMSTYSSDEVVLTPVDTSSNSIITENGLNIVF